MKASSDVPIQLAQRVRRMHKKGDGRLAAN
jgi:hypothetical protein